MNHSKITFADIFKSSFLSKAVETFSVVDVILTMLIATLIGFLIYYVYKKSYNGVMYSHSFNISLVAITAITALVILAVSSNIMLSLGMVGALSIVRFRTAVKESLDVVYLFWAFAVGIVVGAGLYLLAFVGSLVVAWILYGLSNLKIKDDPYLLIVELADASLEAQVFDALKDSVSKQCVKSKVIRADGSSELTIEVRVKQGSTQGLTAVSEIEGVSNAVMVSYNGEFSM